MLRMIIEGVGFDHLKQTVVVLKDWDGQKLLPIWVEAGQAKAIAWELEGVQPPRPGAHDLLLQAVQLAGGRITRIVINDLQNSTFFATLDIDTPHGMKHIDARPSDAIAVAVRAKCPVFVDGGALEALIEMSEAKIDNTSEMSDAPLDLPSVADQSEATMLGEPDEITRFKRLLDEE